MQDVQIRLTPSVFQKKLLAWFDQHGRHDLPWQKNKTLYSVWVSEIMLQQTQVSTVIPYYLHFMARFPTLVALAEASEDDVLACWSGLGYYSRARHLHAAAKQVVQRFQGAFPTVFDDVMTLPGIGHSTAAAILALTLDQPIAILDGNVKRVLARVLAIPGQLQVRSVEQQLWHHAKTLMPRARCADYTQAIMDLGATLCTRSKPQCHLCPMHADCLAYNNDQIDDFPEKKPKKTVPIKARYFLVLTNAKGEIFLVQRHGKRLWGGLWTTPIFKTRTDMRDWVRAQYGTLKQKMIDEKPKQHVFSHFKLHYTPVYLTVDVCDSALDGRWFSAQQAKGVGLPKPMLALFAALNSVSA